MTDPTQPVCERCGKAGELKEYKPNAGKHPLKVVNLCGDCASKDAKLIPTAPPVEVPTISPAVPDTCVVTAVDDPADPSKENRRIQDGEVIEFKGQAPEPITSFENSVSTQAEMDAAAAIAGDPQPVGVEGDVRGKLAKHEEDLNKLFESRQRILAQIPQKVMMDLRQVNDVIQVKKVAIAAIRDALAPLAPTAEKTDA